MDLVKRQLTSGGDIFVLEVARIFLQRTASVMFSSTATISRVSVNFERY